MSVTEMFCNSCKSTHSTDIEISTINKALIKINNTTTTKNYSFHSKPRRKISEKKSYSLIKLKSIYYSNKTQVIKMIRKTEVQQQVTYT